MMGGSAFQMRSRRSCHLTKLHGNLALSLEKMAVLPENCARSRKSWSRVSTYPLPHLGFNFEIMLGLQLFAPSNGCTKYWYAIDQFLSPTLFGAHGRTVVLFLFSFLYRKSARSKFLKLVPSSFRERPDSSLFDSLLRQRWGNLIGKLGCLRFFTMMQEQKSRFSKIGRDLALSFRP